MEFGSGYDTLFYVETNEMNRPYKVKLLNMKTMKENTIFVDPDPTHYLDIQVSKDKRYLIINSGTKEDNEVWVLDRFLPED